MTEVCPSNLIKEQSMNGLLIVNKPEGYTSHDIVNIVRKKLNIKKVGHTGTLDPNATGVLPILIGQATKISKYLVEHKKTYIATLKLGEQRDTGDSEGEIINQDLNIKVFNNMEIEQILLGLLGRQQQIPPMHSAIKVNGKKLYEYARKGQEIEIKPRDIEIYNISLKNYNKKDEVVFEVECSKGTYIRTLCEDIAKKLGTIGYMAELQRTKVNEFEIKNAISLEDLDNVNLQDKLISIEKVFEDKPKIDLDNRKLELFLNGVQLTHDLNDGVYTIYNDNKFIGLATVKNKLLKRDVVI